MMEKLYVLLILTVIIAFAGCVESADNNNRDKQADLNKTQGILDNLNRLYGDYEWKLDLVAEIQQRTDAQGSDATTEMYIEWKRRNNESIEAGERLATYIIEHRNVLTQYWTSDVLVLIAKNKVTFERDNQGIEQKIYSLEQPQKRYGWKIDYYGRDGSRDLGTLTFVNKGKNLSNVKFIFEFYESNGATYSEQSVPIGNVSSGKTVFKKVSLPGRYIGEETWSQEKVFLYINGSVKEIMVYENDEWIEEEVNTTN
ncbi:MAG: hypothetical protein O8C61_01890 [Candidatus Methanoperedens sp.]|nr:hypothetical protein [Candidatus Methanoperedens sp.]